jgi:hypothetical protein
LREILSVKQGRLLRLPKFLMRLQGFGSICFESPQKSNGRDSFKEKKHCHKRYKQSIPIGMEYLNPRT